MQIIKNKTDITNKVKELRKFGWKVIIFQTNRRGRNAANFMTDYLILGHNRVIFAEAKFDKDVLSKGQEEIKRLIESAIIETPSGYKNLDYYLLTEKNTIEIVNLLIQASTQ